MVRVMLHVRVWWLGNHVCLPPSAGADEHGLAPPARCSMAGRSRRARCVAVGGAICAAATVIVATVMLWYVCAHCCCGLYPIGRNNLHRAGRRCVGVLLVTERN